MIRSLHLYQALLIAPMLCAQYTATVKTTVTKTESSDWKKWSDKECVLNYPSTWTNEGALGTRALAIFFAPATANGEVRERVALSSLDATGKTMEQLMAEVETLNLMGYSELRKVSSTVEGDQGIVELLGTLDGQPVKLKRELTLRGNKAWVLGYVAPASKFEDALYLADAMFMSFAVK
jgi:hypothetical protein